jgi:hypothetical protein
VTKAAVLALALLCAPLAYAESLTPYVWNDVTGKRDMPWLGGGGRAHYYKRDVTKPWDFMNPRGPTIETRWGASGSSGEDPWQTRERAVAYLERIGALKAWPSYPPLEEGHPGAVAYPFRVTIVCLEPLVAILRFDLSAALPDPIEFFDGAMPPSLQGAAAVDQDLAGRDLPNAVMFGSRVSARGTLLWFSPDGPQAPAPLDLSSGRARIAVKGVVLELEKKGEEIVVVRR